jgi:hypothetical protein
VRRWWAMNVVIFVKAEMSIRKEAEELRAHFITILHEINAKNHQSQDPIACVCVCIRHVTAKQLTGHVHLFENA